MGWVFRTLGALGAGLVLAAAGAAQEASPNPVMTAVDYFSPDDVQQQPLELLIETLDITVELAAGYAETTTEIAFRNPTDDQLEGQFVLDLPDGAIVTGYGLDIDGRMIPGVIVESKKAKKAFEQRIRNRVDPGLGEVTRENNFKNRVFPIEPGATRTVSVSFTAPYSEAAPYQLPLSIDETVSRVSVQIIGDYGDVDLPNEFGDTRIQNGGVSARDVSLSSGLTIAPPREDANGSVQRHPNGQLFVALTLPEPAGEALSDTKNLRIYWDASVSHQFGIDEERKAIEAALAVYRPERVEIVAFANGAVGDRLYADNAIDAGARLESLQTNGATNLEQLYADEIGKTGADVCILVTDGQITLGALPTTALPCRLYTLSGSPAADRGALTLLAKRGGGRFIDAARGTGEELWRLAGTTLSNMRAGGEALSVDAEWSSDGTLIRIVAPVAEPIKSLSVQVNGETKRVPVAQIADGTMLGAVWAGHHLETLRASAASWAERVRVAQEYGVAGKEGSFLVLETIEDYVEQRLDLPRSGFDETERAAHAEFLTAAFKEDERARDMRLETVATEWDALVDWYRTDFSAVPKKPEREGDEDGNSYVERSLATPSAEPEPMMAMEAADEMPAEDTIVVTGASRPQTDAPTISVQIRKWSPRRPYLKAVKGLCDEAFKAEYFEQRRRYGDMPGFYLEMADAVTACEGDTLAAEIVLSAVELPAANVDTMSAVANRLMTYGAYDEAIDLYRRVVAEDANRPQPWRDLALALEIQAMRRGTSRGQRRAVLSEALDLLAHIIETPWDDAYDGIELISVIEANRIRDRLMAVGGEADALDRRLRNSMAFDLRVTAAWNVDETDMDLWIDEPTGERVKFSNPLSRLGGRLSNDMTNGYGPEEYLIREAAPGTYEVRMHYYRSDIVNPNGAVVLRAHIYRGWGTRQQTMETVDLEFTSDDESEYLVATFEVGAGTIN